MTFLLTLLSFSVISCAPKSVPADAASSVVKPDDSPPPEPISPEQRADLDVLGTAAVTGSMSPEQIADVETKLAGEAPLELKVLWSITLIQNAKGAKNLQNGQKR